MMKPNVYAGLVFSLFLIIFSIGGTGCGGGGGGSSSESLIPEGPITYNIGTYSIGDVEQHLQINSGKTGLTNVSADLQGIYDTTTNHITVEQNRSVTVQSNTLWEDYNSYVNTCRVTVLNEIHMNKGEFPTQGSWEISFEGQNFESLGFDSIIMEITDTGVDITAYLSDSPIDGMPVSLTWDELDGIGDQDDPPAYQLFSWIGYSVWMYYYELMGIEYSSMKQIYDNATDLALNETVTINGPVFPPDTGTRGKLVLTWIDSSSDGIMGQRDSFTCSFTNWWEDVPANDRDGLFNGSMYLTDFIKNDNNLGFNCEFNSFIINETYNGAVVEGSQLTVNGGFKLLLSW
jgi:hypothetical protein